MTRLPRLALAALILSLAGLMALIPSYHSDYQAGKDRTPDFSLYPAGELRKAAFFNYLKPIVSRENTLRQADRLRLLQLKEHQATRQDTLWIEQLAARYQLPDSLGNEARIDALLHHVDTIPMSLTLAQAAKESAWGTSRFAVDGHNYFGQRCYNKGCGLVPTSRRPGERFEVRQFDSAEASVASYMDNINSHREYAALRDYRAHQRLLGRSVSGIQAAERMIQYSERRQAYVDEIQSLIHFNKLDQLP